MIGVICNNTEFYSNMCGILYFYVVVYIIDTYIFLIKFCVHCMLKLYMSRAI